MNLNVRICFTHNDEELHVDIEELQSADLRPVIVDFIQQTINLRNKYNNQYNDVAMKYE